MSAPSRQIEQTLSQWLRCRFGAEGCRWPGVRFYPGQTAEAEDVREAHERHCRYRHAANL